MRQLICISACLLTACSGSSVPTSPPPPPPPPPPVAVFGTGPADCVGGLADGYACNAIKLGKNITLSELGAGSGNDIWGWTDPTTGSEYALMGLNNGTAFVRIDDPKAPVVVGKLPTQTVAATWRDIKVYNNHAYITADNAGAHGMQIFDLTRLRTNSTNLTFSADALYSNFTTAHNITIDETSGYAYIVGTNTCGGGLHIVDVRQALNPIFQSCHAADGDTHDAQCVSYIGPDVDYAGREICFNSNEDSIGIVDVSNKSAAVSIASRTYPDLVYTHQAWVDETQTYMIVNDELDERDLRVRTSTFVFDVSDLDNPNYLYTHQGTTNAIDHNLYVVGNKVYQANYRAGLRVLEFTDLSTDTFSETAFFDTFPTDNEVGFDGAWSVYPFFASGTIVVSDINRGLFILSPE